MQTKSKKTIGPYVILASFAAIITACVVTIIISLDYPVYLDNYYFSSVNEVDKNINDIEKSQENFEKKFSLTLANTVIYKNEESRVKVAIKVKDGSEISNLNGEILLTRPDNSKFDKNLSFKFDNNFLISDNFSVDKLGRWQVLIKLTDGKDIGFYKFELVAL